MNTDNKVPNDADDFMAGFNEGDEQAVVEQKPVEAKEALVEAEAAQEVETSEGGVDTSENGTQLPDQPQELSLDGLPDDLRQSVQSILEANEQLRRERDSLHGRVAPVQRELDIARRQLASVHQQPAPQQQPQPQAALTASAQAQAHFESPEWKEYEKLYPEDAAIHKRSQLAIAQAADARLGQLESVLGNQIARMNEIEQERKAVARRAELDSLAQAHPDWQQINESEEFWGWLDSRRSLFGLTDERAMRERLNNGNYVAGLLDLYKSSAQIQGSTASPPAPATNTGGVRQPASAALRLAAAPSRTGGGVTRPRGPATEGDEFMAGYNSTDD